MSKFWLRIIALCCVIVFGCTAVMVGINSGLTYNREQIQIMWLNLDDKIRHRYEEVPYIIRILKHNQIDSSEDKHIINLYNSITELSSVQGPNEVARVYHQLENHLSRVLSLANDYPKILENPQFKNYVLHLEQSKTIIFTEHDNYNKAVELYNVQITKFPHILLFFEREQYFGTPNKSNKK